MTGAAYPPALPVPAGYPFVPRERRAVSPQPGLTQHRTRAREQIVDVKGVRWVYSPAQMAAWRAWYEDTLLNGQLWFAVSLPGDGGWRTRVARYVSGTVRDSEGAGFFTVTADLEVNGSRVPPTEYGSSFVIDLDGVTNAGTTSAVGVEVTGLDASRGYVLSMEPGGTYVAWSSNAGGGGSWYNRFYITTSSGNILGGEHFATYFYPEVSRASFIPQTISGFSEYVFWIVDNAPGDNSGGLSITITPA
jgi:hypothetical protein